MYYGINNYCSACSSGTWDWVCRTSLGFGNWARSLPRLFAWFLSSIELQNSNLDIMLFCSFYILCSYGTYSIFHTYNLFCSPIWANTHYGVYWCLFSHRISIGTYLCLGFLLISFFLREHMTYLLVSVWAGHECESSWDSTQVDIFWGESASLSTVMVLYTSCNGMCYYTNELFKQGIVIFLDLKWKFGCVHQFIWILSNLLCI